EPSQIRLESYTYMYQQTYGSPETDKRPVRIASIRISADRREIMLQCEGLRAGYVHELELPALPSGSGKSLRQRFAYYTLNRLHPCFRISRPTWPHAIRTFCP